MTRVIGALFTLATLGGLAGVGSVALAFWLYGQDLPDTESLADYEPATLTRVYSGEGRLIAEFAEQRRIFTPVDEIPDLVKQAFISAEDKNFYEHPGVDPMGIARAVVANIENLRSGGGARLQGASTITQQVMKNFLVGDEYSVERKIKEAILSLRISGSMSKDKILELYLNEIFLGQNAYGVTAAAQRYFGKPLEALTVAEAAYLAALPKAPSDLHPVRQRARAIGRRDYVLREMRENGYIDRETFEAAREAPLVTLLDDGSAPPQIARPTPPSHFTEEIRRRLTAELGADQLFGGGLTVRATIEPDLQEIAGAALRDRLLSWDRERGRWRGAVARIETPGGDWAEALRAVEAPRDIRDWRLAVVLEGSGDGAALGFEDGSRGRLSDAGPWGGAARSVSAGDVVHVAPVGQGWRLEQTPELQGAFMAMDVETGRVLALQGGFSYQTSVFNRATQALRQPGSSFKPFVYAAALEQGYAPDTVILDAPIVMEQGTGELWKPKNAGGDFLGPAPMRQGLIRSRNLMTIRLAQEIGMDKVADAAERFGVYDDMPAHLSYALGAGETTLWDLVASYAMFANGGWRIEPTVVDRVQDRRGRTIWRHDDRRCPGCDAAPGAAPPTPERDAERVLNPLVAQQIVGMLRGVVTEGTAARPFAGVGGPVAGKTGTTNEARDVWFVGFSPTVAAGCFIGYDEPEPIGRGAFGGTLCAPVVADFFRAWFERNPPGGFEALDRAAIAAAASGTLDLPDRPDFIGDDGAFDDDFFAAAGGFEADGEAAADAPSETAEARAERPAPSSGRRRGADAPAARDGFSTPGGLY